MKKHFSILLVLIFALVLTSCKDDDESPQGVQSKINSVIPESALQIVRGLGMITHHGETPPDITGTHIMKPNLLLRSNIPGDPPSNSPFVNYTVNFYDLDLAKLQVSFTGSASGEKDASSSAVIAGSGNDFSVYGRSTTTMGQNSLVLGVIYSGTIENGTVTKLRRAIIVLDDSKGAPNLMKKDQARVFHNGK